MNKNDLSLGDALKQYVKKDTVEKGFKNKSLERYWKQNMGSLINNYTSNIRLQNDILFVHISSSALKQELSMERAKILSLIRKEFGEDYIQEVVIR